MKNFTQKFIGLFALACAMSFIVSAESNQGIYWVEKANDGTNVEYIVRTDLDGSNKTTVYESPAWDVQNFGSNLQVTSSNIYWVEKANDGTNIKSIVSTNLDGANKVALVSDIPLASNPDSDFGGGPAYTFIVSSDNLYWIESKNGGNDLMRSNLDGEEVTTLYSSPQYDVQNFGSNLQVTSSNIYWVEKANDGTNVEYIVRTDLDGSNKTTVYESPAWDVQNFGSNLQVTSSNIYWVEKANDGTNIESIVLTNLDGTGKTTVYESPAWDVQNFGSNLQVTGSNIYWVEKANDGTNIESVVRTNLDGTNKMALYVSGSYAVQNFGSNLQVMDAVSWEEYANSLLSDIANLEIQVEELEVEVMAWTAMYENEQEVNVDLQSYYEEELSNSQSDLMMAQEEADDLQGQLDNIVPEDGIGQSDVDAAYAEGAASVEIPECEEVATQNIPLDLPEGWSMFGYTCPDSVDAMVGFSEISDNIEIVKDEWGLSYLPSWDFNAMGSLHFSEGYQIKMIEGVDGFQFCSTITPEDGITQADLDALAESYEGWCESDVDNDGICDVDEVWGCMDPDACNFVLEAEFDVGTCTYPTMAGYDCEGNLVEYVVGMQAKGGIVFYVDETGLHGLVADMQNLEPLTWGCFGTELAGADGQFIGTGYQNTIDIVAGCSETPIAASEALAYEAEGYSDWYLPSIDELSEIYNTIGPGGPEGDIAGFGNSGEGTLNWYWSSSEFSNLNAWFVNFNDGVAGFNNKNLTVRVRIIRAF